jgi:hypothetical protein
MKDVATLQAALGRMSPRLMQVLLRRFVEQRSREDFATLFGLSLEAADLLVWKAARALDAALAGVDEPGPLPRDEEDAASRAFAASPTEAVVALGEHRVPLQQALVRAELEAESSPAQIRENWLRRVAIVLVLAAASYFYWRDHFGPTSRRPPEPRQVQTTGNAG